MLRGIIRAHTELMLNPFFEMYERPEDENECYDDEDESDITGNARYIEIFKSKIDDIAQYYEKYF